MLVISDTSPVSNLAIIGRLALLRERYGEVLIPPAVGSELEALTHPTGREVIEQALSDGWLRVEPLHPEAARLVLPMILDRGETEALQLGIHLSASKFILAFNPIASSEILQAAICWGIHCVGGSGRISFPA